MFNATGHEQVKVKVSAQPSIPADANPFHYDEWNMGTNLTRDWVIMHPGYDRKEEPRSLDYMVLVNTRTGQRIRLDLNHQVPNYRWKKFKRFLEIRYYRFVGFKDQFIKQWKAFCVEIFYG